jgi:hypothetical protein
MARDSSSLFDAIPRPADFVAEELVGGRDSPEPQPKGFQGEERSTGIIKGGVLEHDPPREELHAYRKAYEQIPFIQSAIDNYASEVVEPGWYITADDEQTAEELTEYMENVGIVSTETDVNFAELAKQLIIEREIRGTTFVEKVKDEKGNHAALYPLQNDTITVYTKPGKAMLPAPDDDEAEPFGADYPDGVRERGQPPKTAGGETGAYVQFDDIKPRWDSTTEIVYTRNQVVKWARNTDIGDPRGTSRIKRIFEHVDGLLQKWRDNNEAIRFKAWPQIIFEMGDEENPWSEEEINDFIEHYKDGNLGPGLMQAVAGDVSVEEFAGETADIAEDLQFDVNMIMSGLPGPVYSTGGFSQNVAPAVAESQERTFIKEVKETRREIENKFTPYLQQVADDYGLDEADSAELHVGRPKGDVAPEDVSGSIIRYTSDADPGQGEAPNQTESGQQTTNRTGGMQNTGQSPTAGQTNQANQANQAGQADDTEEASSILTAECETVAEELADPRLVSTSSVESDLTDTITDVLLEARESALTEFEQTYQQSPVSGAESFTAIAERSTDDSIDSSFGPTVQEDIETMIEDTLDTLGQSNHTPQITVDSGVRHRQRARTLSQNVQNQTEHVLDELFNDMETQIRRAAQRGDDTSDIVQRVRQQWSEDEIDQRAQLVARMTATDTVNSTKLAEYDRHPGVDGFKVINSCTPSTTPLCRDLACDGEPATAWFDSDESISDQLEAETSESKLFDGFRPIPPIPPYHFGCTSEIVPATRQS